jgi:hypothetical protein
MRHVQQLFTGWYNRTRPDRRRGSLWADRFKHTILEDGVAVWSCWKYIEANPVRAGMVGDAADYRFCSYGVWRQTRSHPFEQNLTESLLPMFKDLFGLNSLSALRQTFAEALDEDGLGGHDGEFALTVRRRVRHWTQGLVIGSHVFIKEVMSRHKPRNRHRMSRTRSGDVDLFAWRKLRAALE